MQKRFNKYSLFLIPSFALLIFALVICIKGVREERDNVSTRGKFQARTAEMRKRLENAEEEEKRVAAEKAAENARLQREAAAQNRLVRSPLVTPVGNGEDEVTVMIYLNGSNLETYSGFATEDIMEILEADSSDKVHILIQTMGTMTWWDDRVAADHSQRFEVKDHELVLVNDNLPQLDCTDPQTLLDFLEWGGKRYKSDRYFLVMWDHGAGAVDGFGYDEWQDWDSSLTIDEIAQALYLSGLKFDFIGMDACIMASIEVCYALYDYCDYCVLSEDFESALGWSYGGWLSALADNTSIDTPSLAKILIDDMVSTNAVDYFGSSSTLALIDERYIPAAMDAWINFAYANEESLLAVNYSREVERSGRAHPKVSSQLANYYITDMLALTVSISSPQTKSMVGKLASCVAYYNCSFDNTGLTGLSVTLPYGDNDFYASLGQVFAGIGIDKRYIQWLGNFQTEAAADNYFDYYDFDNEWEGWEDYEDW